MNPDCIPLPTRPPYGCFPVILDAIKGNITDLKELVHCAYTVVGWALSFYVTEPAVHQAMNAINWKAILEKIKAILPLIITLLS